MAKGDRIKLKGRTPQGVIIGISPFGWVQVDWDKGKEGPKYVDLNEIEII